MSLTQIARVLFLCVVVPGVLLTGGMGSARNAAAPQPVETVKPKGVWDASAGRLCPRDVGYGKFDQPITVQDI
jgi:hypothetical protein